MKISKIFACLNYCQASFIDSSSVMSGNCCTDSCHSRNCFCLICLDTTLAFNSLEFGRKQTRFLGKDHVKFPTEKSTHLPKNMQFWHLIVVKKGPHIERRNTVVVPGMVTDERNRAIILEQNGCLSVVKVVILFDNCFEESLNGYCEPPKMK